MDGSPVSVSGIAAALAKAQIDMGPALKDSSNPAFKSKYADLASVMNACLPALNKHGIAVVQPTGGDDVGKFVDTILLHGETGQSLSCRVYLIVGKNDMQGYGSAVTYARRYGLMCMAGIAPEDDDGNAAAASVKDVVHQEPQTSGQALAQAWNDAVMDSLPKDATPRQIAEAFAAAIIEDTKVKGKRALDNAWNRHQRMIDSMRMKHPDLHERIVDAFEMRTNELEDAAK